jgi:hypothetical protein
MTDYITRTTKITILPKGEPIFSERATHISIEDEAAGEFVAIEQTQIGKIHIDITEWPEIKKAIDAMVKNIKDN